MWSSGEIEDWMGHRQRFSGNDPKMYGMNDVLAAMSGEVIGDLIFLGVTIVAATFGGIYAWKRQKAESARVQKSLKELGYVIGHASEGNRKSITRVWAPFRKPMPLYIQVANGDPIQVIAGRLGVKDIKTGYPEFDDKFVVRSNKPDLANAFLTKDIKEKFMSFDRISFLTGSNDSLWCSDFPKEAGIEPKARLFWMVKTNGTISDEEARPYLEWGQSLAAQLERFIEASKCSFSPEDFQTARFEGR